MNAALTFNDFTFSPVPEKNGIWIRSTELAKALGYCREDKVTRLFHRNEDEFTPEMTQVIEILDNPTLGLPIKTRIFSLRGCHLLAMFARTPVAKAFRKWVLDVLDRIAKEEAQQATNVAQSADRLSKRTDPERKQLTGIINAWVGLAPIHYATARAQVNAHFGVTGIDELTIAQVKKAIQWVQGKIDALAERPEYPMARFSKRVELEGKYREYLEAVEKWRIYNRAESKRLYEMGLDLLHPERCGSAIFDAYAATLCLWLDKTANSNFSVFDGYLDSTRAPVILAAQLNASFELPKILR